MCARRRTIGSTATEPTPATRRSLRQTRLTGLLLHYYLKSAPEQVKITISDNEGNTIRDLIGRTEAGLNRSNWDLRYPRPVEPPKNRPYFVPPPGWRPISFPTGPFVLPGVYTVKVAAGGSEVVTNVVVEEDPRIEISDADRQSHLNAVLHVGKMMTACNQGDRRSGSSRANCFSLEEKPSIPEEINSAIEPISRRLEDTRDETLSHRWSRTTSWRHRTSAARQTRTALPAPDRTLRFTEWIHETSKSE